MGQGSASRGNQCLAFGMLDESVLRYFSTIHRYMQVGNMNMFGKRRFNRINIRKTTLGYANIRLLVLLKIEIRVGKVKPIPIKHVIKRHIRDRRTKRRARSVDRIDDLIVRHGRKLQWLKPEIIGW